MHPLCPPPPPPAIFPQLLGLPFPFPLPSGSLPRSPVSLGQSWQTCPLLLSASLIFALSYTSQGLLQLVFAGAQNTGQVVRGEGHGLFFSWIVPCLDVTPTTEAALWAPGKEGGWAKAIRVEGWPKEGSRSPELATKASPTSPVLVMAEDQVFSNLSSCIYFLTLKASCILWMVMSQEYPKKASLSNFLLSL